MGNGGTRSLVRLGTVLAVLVLGAVLVGVVDRGGDGLGVRGSPVDHELTGRLESLGITLYLPTFGGREVDSVEYSERGGYAELEYDYMGGGYGDDRWSVHEEAAPRGVRRSVCSAINPDNTSQGCYADAGWAYDDYEGDTALYVLRGETLLTCVLDTEDENGLIDQAARDLLAAPEISAEDLSRG